MSRNGRRRDRHISCSLFTSGFRFRSHWHHLFDCPPGVSGSRRQRPFRFARTPTRGILGGRIAGAGILIWLLTISGFVVPPRYRAREQERSRTWGQAGSIGDVIVQGDGKIVLLGVGMVRLLPDGQPDPSFHRGYSFKEGGSLPEPTRNYWPTDGCAISLPNNDLLLGLNGRVSRVLAPTRMDDGSVIRPENLFPIWADNAPTCRSSG